MPAKHRKAICDHEVQSDPRVPPLRFCPRGGSLTYLARCLKQMTRGQVQPCALMEGNILSIAVGVTVLVIQSERAFTAADRYQARFRNNFAALRFPEFVSGKFVHGDVGSVESRSNGHRIARICGLASWSLAPRWYQPARLWLCLAKAQGLKLVFCPPL